MIALLLALQVAASPPPAAATPDRFSILVPVRNQACIRSQAPDDIVVCGDPLPSQELPLPSEAVSSRPQPVNRDMTGTGALAAEGSPCGTVQRGCTTGVDVFGMGTALVRGVQKLISPGSCCEEEGEATNPVRLIADAASGVAKLGKRRLDKSDRMPIDLSEPVTTGRVSP